MLLNGRCARIRTVLLDDFVYTADVCCSTNVKDNHDQPIVSRRLCCVLSFLFAARGPVRGHRRRLCRGVTLILPTLRGTPHEKRVVSGHVQVYNICLSLPSVSSVIGYHSSVIIQSNFSEQIYHSRQTRRFPVVVRQRREESSVGGCDSTPIWRAGSARRRTGLAERVGRTSQGPY